MMFVAPANLILAYAPPLALLFAFRRAAGRGESDPRIVTRGFLAGIPAVLPAIAVLAASLALAAAAPPVELPSGAVLLIRSFVLAAGVEELSKLGVLALVVRGHSSQLTGRVAVLAGAAAGAGFAFVENSLYLLDMPRLLALRLVTAGVLHVATTALCGYGIAVVAYRYGRMLPWVLAAVALHGLYNLLIELGGMFILWAPIVPIIAALAAWSRYNRADQLRLPGRRTRAYPDS